MKICPFCAEKIQDRAIVCRYCGRDLPKFEEIAALPDALEEAPEPNREMSSKPVLIWLIIITILSIITLCLTLMVGIYASIFGGFIELIVIVWAIVLFFGSLISGSVIVGWRSYKKKNFRKAMMVSLLALISIMGCVLPILLWYLNA